MNLGNLLLCTWILGITFGHMPLSYVCSGRGCLCPKPSFKPGGCGFPTVSPSPRALRSRMVEMQCLIPGRAISLFLPNFSPIWRGRFQFSQGAVNKECLLLSKKKNKQDPGPRPQSSLPDPFDWQVTRKWQRMALVQGDKRQDPRRLCVYKHIAQSIMHIIEKPQLSIEGDRSWVPAIKKRTEIQVWRKKRGRMCRGWKYWCNIPTTSLLPVPTLLYLLFPFPRRLYLLLTAGSSLCNGRKIIDLFKSICPSLTGYLVTFLFSQLCLAWLWTRQNNDSMI